MAAVNDVSVAHAGSDDMRGRTFQQLIAGQLVDGARQQEVINPATGASFAVAPVADAAQVEKAVAAAAAAFVTWKDTSLADRVSVVLAIADAIEARREEIATIITL